jgi:acyl-CoA thioester hydrolase
MMKYHDTEIRVRYEDADPMGFLHHAQYFSFFEVGRLDFFRARGGDYRAMEAAGVFVVVAKAECRYRRPARYDDLLTVRTIIHEITPAKIMQRYEMRRGDELLAEGQVTLAVVNREGQVQRVPEWLRDTY